MLNLSYNVQCGVQCQMWNDGQGKQETTEVRSCLPNFLAVDKD